MNNTIVRAARRDRFVTIDHRAIEDTRLSWAARGLLGYLLSRPNSWQVRVNDLQKRGDLGRDGIYRLLRELRDAGYLRFERNRDQQGRIRGGTYLVRETADSPQPDFPDVVKPDTAEPYPVNPEVLTTDELLLSGIITTTPVTTEGNRRRGEDKNSAVEFAAWVPEKFRDAALDAVAHLSPEDA